VAKAGAIAEGVAAPPSAALHVRLFHAGDIIVKLPPTSTGGYMSRAAIVATIVTSILAFSSPSFAASEEEVGKFGAKMSGAFKCSVYAGDSNDLKEHQRLFQIGLKAARDFVEGGEKPQKFPTE
jgi:hypothetical protein